MGRIREYIRVNGKKFWTLFDSGARNTYVVPAVASHLVTTKLPKAFKSAMGGKVRKTATAALLVAQVEGHNISTNAMVIDDIGNDEDAKPIQVLVRGLGDAAMGDPPGPRRGTTGPDALPQGIRRVLARTGVAAIDPRPFRFSFFIAPVDFSALPTPP